MKQQTCLLPLLSLLLLPLPRSRAQESYRLRHVMRPTTTHEQSLDPRSYRQDSLILKLREGYVVRLFAEGSDRVIDSGLAERLESRDGLKLAGVRKLLG